MYPNWSKIQEIKCPFLRNALFLAEGVELERLEAAFPECYSTEQDDLRVPGSLIYQESFEFWANDNEGRYPYAVTQADAFVSWRCSFAIPISFRWNEDDGDVIPHEVRAQFVGKPLVPWMGVEFLGEKFLISRIHPVKGKEPLMGQPFPDGTNYELTLVHSRFVDTTA